MTNEFLINFWFFALALVWVIYIFQETFISGGSFLAIFIKDDKMYEQLNRTIGTHWDGVQVWLILAIGGLFAAFPSAFGDLLSSLYVPMFLLMYVVIVRGLSIELIYKTDDMKMRNFLKKCLAFSSVGMLLVIGIYLQIQFVGTPINDEFFSFLAIFKLQNIIGGITLVSFMMVNGYLFLGMNHGFEVLKPVENFVKYSAVLSTVLFIVVVQILGNVAGVLNVASGTIGIMLILFSMIQTFFVWKNKHVLAFISGIFVIMGFVFTGFLAIFPNAIHYSDGTVLTLTEAAAGYETLFLMFYALLIFLPIVIGYQSFKYIRFWRKS
jgi:cytochrome d ubiquinol oxidase subunit II